MKKQPIVSIIILSHDAVEYTKICIESIVKSKTKIPYELIIVDNGSTEKTREYIRKIDAVKYFSSVNLGVSNGRNIGFSLSSPYADFVCFLDNDTMVPDYWVDKFVETMQSNPQLGIAGSSSNVRNLKTEGFNKNLRSEWLSFCEKNISLSPKKQLEKFYPNGFSAFALQEMNNPVRRILGQQMPPDYIPGWCSFIRKGALSSLKYPCDPE
ncbi:MAG: glycosyltransferase, partial [Microgenomates group bacterium]